VGLYYRTLGKEIEIEESGETRKKKSSENKRVIPGCVKKKKRARCPFLMVCGLACLEAFSKVEPTLCD